MSYWYLLGASAGPRTLSTLTEEGLSNFSGENIVYSSLYCCFIHGVQCTIKTMRHTKQQENGRTHDHERKGEDWMMNQIFEL